MLLIGAMIGMQTGFKGNVTLRKDAPPVNRVITNRSIIQLESPADSALYLMRFDAEATPPSTQRPRTFPVPKTDLKVITDDFSPNLVRDRRFVASGEAADAGSAVRLSLSSNMAGQSGSTSFCRFRRVRRPNPTFSGWLTFLFILR